MNVVSNGTVLNHRKAAFPDCFVVVQYSACHDYQCVLSLTVQLHLCSELSFHLYCPIALIHSIYWKECTSVAISVVTRVLLYLSYKHMLNDTDCCVRNLHNSVYPVIENVVL
jgi:hypothetical protein